MEELLKKQHLEVIKIVNSKEFSLDLTVKEKPKIEPKELSIIEKISRVEGVHRVYSLDNEGNFASPNLSEEFKKNYAAVFKNLFEVVNIFSQLPGGKR